MSMLNFNILPFHEAGDGLTSVRWDEWKGQFVAYLALKGVIDHEELYNALMCFGGPDVRKIAKNIEVTGGILDNKYRAAMEALDNYFAPRMSLRYERNKFRQLKFNHKEKLDQFVLRLKTQAAVCNFEEQVNEMIMDQIVYATTSDDKLRAKYLEADVTLEEMLKIGRTHESVSAQVQEFRSTSSCEPTEFQDLQMVSKPGKLTSYGKGACNRCLGKHEANDQQCPARESRCNNCGKIGHFARSCWKPWKSSSPYSWQNNRKTDVKNSKPPVNRIKGHDMTRKQKFVREVDDVSNQVEIRELFHLDGKRKVVAAVGGVNLQFVVDTGADENILCTADWKTLKKVGFKAFDVRKGSRKIFRGYGSNCPLTVLGEVDAEIEIDDRACSTTFFVIEGENCSLLSGNTAEKLGVLKFLNATSSCALPCIKGEN
ncbi:uncharacterized protein LOC134210288 [Armigeres subalbatus]|uniref:uncharacterized protein LOC134210288 n=1 Tax=Armigeres subalbatus TaxID=124917 RepID=UPI002ED0CAEE